MCGLVGTATVDTSYKDKDIFKDLLYLSAFRGMHSAGFAAMNDQRSYELFKVVGPSLGLINTKGFESCSAHVNNVWIGHTRHTTVGATSQHNAHPFVFGNIIGAHNGTLQNERMLAGRITDVDYLASGLETDSQMLYAHIAEFGVRDTIPRTRGAWALTFYDRNDGILYMHRNDQRPLWYCFDEDMKKMWWSSEWTMLEYAVKRRGGVKLWADKEGFTFFPIEEDTLVGWNVSKGAKKIECVVYEELKGASGYVSQVSAPFNISNLIGRKKEEETPKPKILLPPPTTQKSKSGSSSTETSSSKCQTDDSLKGSRTPKPTLSLVTTNKDESLDDSLLYGPDGQLLFSNEWNKLTSDGCVWCSDNIYEKDSLDIRWVICKDASKKVETIHCLCPSCSQEDSDAMKEIMWIMGSYGSTTGPFRAVQQVEEVKKKAVQRVKNVKEKK